MTKRNTTAGVRLNYGFGNSFAGKRVRQDIAKIKAMKKRDRRLRKVTKGKYSIVSFPS